MPTLSPQELALYLQCINEVLRGFDEPGMEKTVGVSYAVLMKEDAAFYALHKRDVGITSGDAAPPVRALVVAETIRKLGRDDFHARTGCTLDEGFRFLDKMKKTS